MPQLETSNLLYTARHVPALDGIRGLAASAVFLKPLAEAGYVSTWASFGGVFGVSIFFALSGFLMAYLYGRQPFNSQTAVSYAVNRAARIAPLYLSVIVISWIIVALVDPTFVYNINNHNLVRHLLFSGSESVFWSIPPEVQFYVFFLFMWWSISCLLRQNRIPMFLLLGSILVMYGFSSYLPGTTLPTKLSFFLFGACAGIFRSHVPQFSQRFRIQLLLQCVQCALLLSVAVYASILFFSSHSEAAVYKSITYSALCALMILSFSFPSTLLNVSFGSRPMRALGAWSFALYLLHVPSLYWAEQFQLAYHLPSRSILLMGVLLALLFSYACHTIIERPAQTRFKAGASYAGKLVRRLYGDAIDRSNGSGRTVTIAKAAAE
jgi:peptidoglycan/LPS O-acetylase OafA/YrhL